MRSKRPDPRYVQEVFDKNTEKYELGYEYERWEKGELLQRDYHQTKEVIRHHLKDIEYNSLLEVGCGPGTWTKVVYKNNAHIVLVDISYRMLKIAREHFPNDNISYVCSNFEEPGLRRQRYDLFFSVRAFEYMHKQKAVKNAYDMLVDHGKAYIITKNPLVHNHLLKTLVQRFTFGTLGHARLHRDQISPFKLSNLMREIGFRKVDIFPVVFVFRIRGARFKVMRQLRTNISNFIWRRNYKRPLRAYLIPLIESFLIVGEK